MKTTKPSHRIIAVFLTLNFLTSLFPVNLLYASNNAPTTPEASSFEPVDATDIVNLATGDLSYVLPLLNVPSPEGGYPLALSYHAGIAADQEASWTGLGWTLNPGAINRSISGVPDDWLETKKYSMMYNDIGLATDISLGFTAGLKNYASYGASLNYSSFKATGGETSYNFGIRTSTSFAGFTNWQYLGTNGIGVGQGYIYGNLGVGTSQFQSFKSEGFKVGANASVGGIGFGVNLSSNGVSTNASIGGANINLSGGNDFNSTVHNQKSGFLLDFFFVDFSYFKTKYWLYDASHTTYNGALYAGKINDTFQNIIDPSSFGMDAYESVYEADKNEQLRNANYSSVSYDNYNVNAQGIGGKISPKLLENGSLFLPNSSIRNRISVGGQYQVSLTNTSYLKSERDSRNFSKSLDENNVHFYFDNEYSSFLNISSNDWSAPLTSNTYSDLTNISISSKNFDDTNVINGEFFDSYNEVNKRLKKGNFIETFTNEDISQNPHKIIQPLATGFNRISSEVPQKGIGAFRVTALDGKTYHYSLPVYQKEQFNRISNVEDNSEDNFLEEQQFEPYATHWLLTAVTGSDYFDKNGNNKVDKDDYGYWASFEYGKWSDGFAWRNPIEGFHSNGTTNSYSWGVKEIYYLDRVRTRTHTALFIKDLRADGNSYVDKISNGNNPKHYYIPGERSIIQSEDGNYYSQGTHLDVQITDGLWQNYYSTSDFWIYADMKEQRSLRLDKILLLKNEDAVNVVKNNSTDINSKLAGRIFAEAKISLMSYNGSFVKDVSQYIDPDHTWYGEYFNNILNSNDLDMSTLTEKSLKTIDFNYDETYPLSRKSSESQGKLTLKSVNFKGKKGVQLMPPYSFEYYAPTATYSEDTIDDWGYLKNNSMAWSLDNIKNPLGGIMDIIYENDFYVDEYAKPTTFFSDGLEFKFEGTNSGSKTLSFRNDPNVESKYHIDFSDYFTAGQSTKVDSQFWHFTTNNDNWIADIANQCIVQSVSSNLIVFEIPQVNQNWGREFENCSKEDWVFYDSQYHHVVDMTVGWLTQTNENSCERPVDGTNRSRYKVFAQKEPLNSGFGGGVRVKDLVVSANGRTTKTTYTYKNENGEETGVTSYAVSKRNRVIPYISELPSPMVLYSNINIEETDQYNNAIIKKNYVFEVPKPIQYLSNRVLIENALQIEIEQDNNYNNISVNNEDVDVQLSRFLVSDYSGNIGRLLSYQEYNLQDQLLKNVENSYLPDDFDHDQGVLKETFSSYKKLRDYPLKDKYIFTSSSTSKVPSILSKTVTRVGGLEREEQTIGYDFFTGQGNEFTSTLSDGKIYKTKTTSAYNFFQGMGSKVDNPSNKNMLSQEAMTITEKFDGGQWEKTGASITTWDDWGNNIWRKQKSFTWDGSTDSNGYFTNYTTQDDNFDWVNNMPGTSNSEWKQLSEITRYNDFSMPLEVRDINQNYASTKMGHDDSKTIASSNAGYGEMFYSGAEDDDGTGNYGGEVGKGSATDSNDAHTGGNALNIGSGQNGYRATVATANGSTKKFKVSLWVKNGQEQYVRFYNGSQNLEPRTNETVRAGNWKQLTFYPEINDGAQVYVTTVGGSSIVDDFRIHPISSSMTSYVYNEWGELSHILGTNNMATYYIYDAMGRLKSSETEVADFASPGSGGFKKASEIEYTYKY